LIEIESQNKSQPTERRVPLNL